MADLARLIREARLDDPKSLRRLASALNREGYDDGVLKQFELTWWAPSGVVLRNGVLFEGGRHNRFRVQVRDNLGYHLAVHPVDAWSEAEIALTEDSRFLARRKTFWRRRLLLNVAEVHPSLEAIGDAVNALREQSDNAPDQVGSERLELEADALAGALEWAM